MLRDLTACEPVLTSHTRWTGNHDCLFQCTRMEDDLVTGHEDVSSNLRMSTSIQFTNNVSKFRPMLKVTMHATKKMETKCYSVPSCWEDLDMLEEDSRAKNETIGHAMNEMNWKTSSKLTSLNFTNGVVKMQNNDMESMTSLEHIACSSLLVSGNSDQNEDTSISTTSYPALTDEEHRDLFKKPRCGKFLNEIYFYLNFIICITHFCRN